VVVEAVEVRPISTYQARFDLSNPYFASFHQAHPVEPETREVAALLLVRVRRSLSIKCLQATIRPFGGMTIHR
jgi:hypothetical protein